MTIDGKEKECPSLGLFKFNSVCGKLWYGTFKTKDEGVKRMKKDYPNDQYKIIEL